MAGRTAADRSSDAGRVRKLIVLIGYDFAVVKGVQKCVGELKAGVVLVGCRALELWLWLRHDR